MINISEFIRAFFLNTQTEDFITIYKSGKASFDYARYFSTEEGGERLAAIAKRIEQDTSSDS